MKIMTLGRAIDRVEKNMLRLGIMRKPECYSVSEAVFRLVGGAGYRVKRIPGKPQSHWFLEGQYGEIIDLTAGQFSKLPRYDRAVNAAFYPQVSNLAKELMK